MNLAPDFVAFFLTFLWLVILTFFLITFRSTYSRMTKNGKKESIMGLMEDVLAKEEENKKTLDQLVSSYDKINRDGLSHIQKIGLVRFNPFKDTGGDQSFILALVDAENTGVIISSLHTRTGTRWYAKGVVLGKGAEYDLSEDEERALKGAKLLAATHKK
ncbi:MAG TPA: DUF4446 family protein [Patescibacteria group bacterium]|nr:DUF4446 family protein [Patescibacteria group bacterium]